VKFVIGLMGLGKCIFDISCHLFSIFNENNSGFYSDELQSQCTAGDIFSIEDSKKAA